MNAMERYNSPAFRERMNYFSTREFEKRFDAISARIRKGYKPSSKALFEALGCTAEEWAVYLTLVDATRAHTGKRPVHGFPAITNPTEMAIDVKIARDGRMTDYRFSRPFSPMPDGKPIAGFLHV